MRSLRERTSKRLLDAGARLAIERRQMLRSQRRNPPAFDRGDAQLLYVAEMLDLMSTAAIRLGVMILPRCGNVPG